MAGFGWNSPLNNFNNGMYGNVQQPMQTQAVMQSTYMPIQVRDEAEAKAYPVAANTTISMVDATMTHLWVKSTNASGTVVAFRMFDLIEKVEEKPQYITKADFEAFKKELFDSLGGK